MENFTITYNLLSRLLKRRYFHLTNILNAGLGSKPSFIWKSLLEGRDFFKKGLCFFIGDGKEKNAWLDPWLPTHLPRPPRRIEGVESDILYVGDMMNERSKTWNKEVLEATVVAEDVARNLKLRLRSSSSSCLLGWSYTDS